MTVALRPSILKIVLVTFAALCAVTLALFLGATVAVLPWFLLAALLSVPLFVGLGVLMPSMAFAGQLLLIYGLVPTLGILGATGRIQWAAELGLAFLLLVLALRGGLSRATFRPFVVPLGVLWTVVGLSAYYAWKGHGISSWIVYSEARVFAYWVLAVVMVAIAEIGVPVRRIYLIVIGASVALAVALTLQSVLGLNLVVGSRVEPLRTMSTTYWDVVRSTGGGVLIVLIGLFLTLAGFLLGRIRWYGFVPLLAILLPAIVVSFGRGIWVAALLGTAIVVVLARQWRKGAALLVTAVVLTVGMLASLSTIAPQVLVAFEERALSIRDEIRGGRSFGWRVDENKDAVDAIAANPILGVGLGGEYRKTYVAGTFEAQTRYVHNGYLYLIVKVGLVALIPLLVMVICFFRAARVSVSQDRNTADRAVGVAATAGFAVVLILSFTQPELMAHTGVASLALCWGLVLLSGRAQEVPSKTSKNGGTVGSMGDFTDVSYRGALARSNS
jgi:O-antigen ligase